MVVSRSGLFGLQCCQLEGQRQSGTQNTLPGMAAGIAEQQSSSQSRAEEQQWQYEADSVGDEGDKAAGREAQEETCFEDCWAQTANPNPSRECPCLLLGFLLIKQMFYASDGEPEARYVSNLAKSQSHTSPHVSIGELPLYITGKITSSNSQGRRPKQPKNVKNGARSTQRTKFLNCGGVCLLDGSKYGFLRFPLLRV